VAVGATAYAGVPITYPGAVDAVVLLRGHEGEIDSTPDVDWSALAKIEGTIVCYVGERLAPRVLEHGPHGLERREAGRAIGLGPGHRAAAAAGALAARARGQQQDEEEAFHGGPQDSRNGSVRSRLPVSANTAFATAGAIGAVAGSPMPPIRAPLGMMWTETFGISCMRSTG